MGSRKSGKARVWLRRSAWVLLILALLPPIEVACVRFINPPVTPLMWLRDAEASWEGKPKRPRQYQWLSYQHVPLYFLRCVITSEDQRFFRHHGFDWKEVAIAQAEALRKGKEPRGASTISMQCARSLFLWQGRSWIRKGLEVYYTFWMELFLSKRRILELYVNVIEMGDRVYGLQAAAHAHFATTAEHLTRDQCALITAILPNPRKWNPASPTAKVVARKETIMKREPGVSFKF